MSANETSGFPEKVLKLLDGTADDADFAALDRRISQDPKAARYYVDVLTIHLALSRTAGMPADDPSSWTAGAGLDALLANRTGDGDHRCDKTTGTTQDASRAMASEQERVEQIRLYAQQRLDAFLEQQRKLEQRQKQADIGWWDLVATGRQAVEKLDALTRTAVQTAKVLLVSALVVGLVLTVAGYFYSHRVVATVVDSVHAQWGEDLDGTNLKPGWRRLEEGFAQVAFKSGAEILLQAPCTFELRSSNRVTLSSGRMAAKVPPEAHGFSVQTPASTVVDYGTEFGVLVGTRGESEVHVFTGEIALSAPTNSKQNRPQKLNGGQAAQVDRDGGVRLDSTSNRPRLFVQDLPAGDAFGIPGKRLDLADIVGGGNGFGTGRMDSLICTGSGQFTAGDIWLDVGSRSGYVPVHALPYVDGVFVPDGSEGLVIVSSGGHRFSVRPDTDGMMHNGFVSAGVYRLGRPFRVDLSQSGDLEPGWTDWSTGAKLENASLARTFTADFDPEFTVIFDSVDTRNRGQVDSAVPLHDLLDDDFKESDSVIMRLQELNPGRYTITTYHHDPREDSRDSDGTINVRVIDAQGERIVAQRFWQSWGPNPKVVASATFPFESDGREVVIIFQDNDDAIHNEAHINGFELDVLQVMGSAPGGQPGSMIQGIPRPELDGQVFGTRAHPAIYMHANVGITFDLEALREALSGARIVAFSARCALMMDDAADAMKPPSRAGFWVLVDGEERFRHIEDRTGVGSPVDVALNDHDRFLTVVTTDGGDGHLADRCFFGDPALRLEWPR